MQNFGQDMNIPLKLKRKPGFDIDNVTKFL